MLLTNDFLNPNTGVVDPRHMYGATNQDVFRWPAIRQGIERMLLGIFITTLHMPGIPMLLWGEEQAFATLDSTADNYIYGRQSMSSSPAWHAHGCYAGGSAQYYEMPLEAARVGCLDEKLSWDHRDPSHPVRNIIKSLYQLRAEFPVLQDGLFLQQLSNQTEMVQYPGSNQTKTETGIWSVMRSAFHGVQDFGNSTEIWLVYHNRNETTNYEFDCSSNLTALIAPFPVGTTVKNLIFPHDEFTLSSSPLKLGIHGSEDFNGCTASISMQPFEFRAYVPKPKFVPPPAMVTKFLPGHDARILSTGINNTIKIEFHTSAAMDCDRFSSAIEFISLTNTGRLPFLDKSTVVCAQLTEVERPPYVGAIASAWGWSANIVDVSDGIHQIIVRNATTQDLGSFTNCVDRFLLRVGSPNNPVVFPLSGNYSTSLLQRDASGNLAVRHDAAGATKWRYSLNWGSSWSDWKDYRSGIATVEPQAWAGTRDQEWSGHHVTVQYFSSLLGSSSFLQHGDLDVPMSRRFPHLFAHGPFNRFGFDAGLNNQLQLASNGVWEWHFMTEWPSRLQLSVWGINPDGQPDQGFVYGDIDGDFILDRLPPSSLVESAINITKPPKSPALAYKLRLNDGTFRYELIAVGNQWNQLLLYILLWTLPLIGGIATVLIFRGSFYKVKFVEMGLNSDKFQIGPYIKMTAEKASNAFLVRPRSPKPEPNQSHEKRRTVLIATMEYNIDDWNIKIKIGGLGVMAQLMGKSLQSQDLVWCVPCVSGIEYPLDTPAEPMLVTVLGEVYEVKVQYHKLENITYVLLDAPVFRKQTKTEPYPPRMDDLESAIYYSAWNQCIAETARRFPVDLYHINDYHGAAALLHLLPQTIPACLSLHNAEFQGMWPMRTPTESKEVCDVFNLNPEIVARYVQYGSVFNLLHAGASYLRIHQRGFGAVGVSKKYGDRSFARYPIFWGLTRIGQLPNPDPTDTAEWNKEEFMKDTTVTIDSDFEVGRAELKRQAQEWAGLEVNPNADLFVFVGRWSLQKGVDLIADIFPSILEKYSNTQLICIGPLIDLYGKFAALKLSKLMERYPGRLYSKPEFTALPPYIFSGAEFALIPSRDEPFGLVAVEFGRKGALGVGARVGGLGQMPGWWYTIESTSASHLLAQFKEAITSALETKQEIRAMMRAWSAKQRFPVAQWLEDLDTLQSTAIAIHEKTRSRATKTFKLNLSSDTKEIDLPRTPVSISYERAQAMDGGMFLAVDGNVDTPLPSPPGLSPFSSGYTTPTRPLTPEERASRGRGEPCFMEIEHDDRRPIHSSIGAQSMLSLQDVIRDRNDFRLQKVDPFFTDSNGEFYAAFDKKLECLTANNSATELCIEDYLIKSEKEWFTWYREAKLGRLSRPQSRAPSVNRVGDNRSQLAQSIRASCKDESQIQINPRDFGIDEDYVPPTGLKK
jgi:alpha-1,3-glucan synthase